MRKLAYLSLGAAVAAGCGSDPGSIQVRWTIGANNDCGDIETVRITLHEESGATEGPFTAPCAAGTSAPFTLNDVDEGDYTIALEGLDGAGNVIFSGESSARYSVNAGQTTTTDAIALNPAPPTIRVLWRFSDGRPCGQHGITQIEARAFLVPDQILDATETAGCDAPQILLQEGLRMTPVGSAYEIQLNGKDASGATLFRYTTPTEDGIVVSAGGEAEVDGVLEPCEEVDGGCP